MINPNWKTAPSWANYAAMDKNGNWYWYENKPVASKEKGEWDDKFGGFVIKCKNFYNWEDSLKQKPNQGN